MLVQAVEGRRIRHPRTGRIIPPEGIEVPDHDMFFLRCVAHGDLTISDPQKAKPAEPENEEGHAS